MNRKTWLFIKLVLLVCIFLILTIGSMFFLKADTSKMLHIINFTSSGEGEVKSFSNVEKIQVNAVTLPVHIYESDVEQVTVTDNSKQYGIGVRSSNKLTQEEDTLIFTEGKGFQIINFSRGEIIIEVPKGLILEYDIHNASGSIRHNAPSKNELRCENVSGSTRIYQGGQSVFVESVSGSIRVYEPFEELTATSVSGSIRTVANENSKQMNCSNVSGSIRIQLENVTGYDMNYSTLSSDVEDNYTDTEYKKSGDASYGDKSLKIDVSNTTGSIKLTDWD